MGEVGTFLYLIFGYKRKGGNRKQAYLIIGLLESCLIKSEFYMRLTAFVTPLCHPFRFYGRYRGEIKKNKL